MPLVIDAQCESCGRPKGQKHKATESKPSIKRMERWVFDGVAEATDGCTVEPDGVCEHGHSSWLLVLGFI